MVGLQRRPSIAAAKYPRTSPTIHALRPTQNFARIPCVGKTACHVSRPASSCPVKDSLTCIGTECPDHLKQGNTLTGPKISHQKLPMRGTSDCLYSSQMSLHQIHHVNAITHTCSVVRSAVISKYLQLRKQPDRNLPNKGEKVRRRAQRRFALKSTWVRPHRIEVPQTCDSPSRVCRHRISQNSFAHELG